MIVDIKGHEYDTDKPESIFINADCMEYLPLFPDNYFDLAIVDPPYGIGADKFNNGAGLKDHGNGSTTKKLRLNRMGVNSHLKDRSIAKFNCSWDIEPPKKEYFDELFRVSKNQIIWGGNYFDLPPTRGIICWDKEQPWENFSAFELAWTSFNKPAAIFRYCNAGGVTGEKKIHATQKPIALYKWLIAKYANEGDIILDTHTGSASSLVAYRETNHRYVGFEIDEQYYESARERVDAAEAQMNIFDFIGGHNE